MSQSKISLSFSKKIEKVNLQTSALQNSSVNLEDRDSQKHSISSFDKSNSLIISRKEDNFIIPLISSKRSDLVKKVNTSNHNGQQNTKQTENGEDRPSSLASLDELAAAAILEETKLKIDASHSDQNTIKLDSAVNLDSEGFDQLGSISTLDDYEKVSVESYGAALLRGMGWSKSLGVGKNNRRVVDIVEPTSKSLGLTVEKVKQEEGKIPEEEAEELKKGCFVLIHSGRNKGSYGTVQTMDEDHMLIKPARGDKILREVEPNVRAVSAKEFKDFSRVINKDMYDQYKAEELKKKDEENKKKNRSEDLRKGNYKREKEEDRKRSDHTKSEKGIKRSRDKPEFDNRQEEEHARNDYYSSKERKKRDKDHKKYSPEIDKINLNKNEPSYERKERTSIADKKEESSKSKYYERVPKIKNGHDPNEIEFNERSEVSSAPPIIWARENLRVRLIDTKYKGGKHHKEKVIVRSVDTMESCSCITDDEKMLWDVKLSNLETVIPKQSSSLVLILNGSFKGQKGKILELHKEKEKATVQLLTDSSVILKLLYDDICEYVNR